MKKLPIIFAILFTLTFCIDLRMKAGDANIFIRQARAEEYTLTAHLYIDVNEAFELDIDNDLPDDLPSDLIKDSIDTTTEPPDHGDITKDGWEITYEPDDDYEGTDKFTIYVYDDEDETNRTTYYVDVDVFIGEVSEPSDFWISIKYDGTTNPDIDISWDGAYNATYFQLYYQDSEDGTYNEYTNGWWEDDFRALTFGDLFPYSIGSSRLYISMTGSKLSEDEIETDYTFPTNSNYLESDYSDSLILDPINSDFAPNTPTIGSVKLSGLNQVIVTFSGNDNMLDLKEHEIKYWLADGSETEADAASVIVSGRTGSATLSNLLEETSYYVKVIARDYDENTAESAIHQFVNEKTYATLEDPETFEGGCFISDINYIDTAMCKAVSIIIFSLLVLFFITRIKGSGRILIFTILCILIFQPFAFATEKSTTGFKVNILQTQDDTQELSYGDTAIGATLFYDRELYFHFSIELEAGYILRDGYEYTESGNETDIETTLTLVPVSSSLKFNYQISRLITAYIGGGPDFWYYREKNDFQEIDAFEDEEYGVGGYHGKIGVYLRTKDKDIKKNIGMIVEVTYSKIDRFGDNEIDLGGIHYNLGIFYKF